MANLKNTKGAKTKSPEATTEVLTETAPDVTPDVTEDVVTVSAPPEITVAPTENTEDEVKVEVPETKEIPDKNVKIKLRVDHKCHIGKESYNFIAGKIYTVPQNVKRILQDAGLLSAL